ncbi:component of the Tol biopolymer transport system [Cyclobacterium lianum]|uniref:Component of the Tol biopolymer transport system n=1 Tax=Cyclobacterium lianum TaxID=388280 RepID=A0A1M7PWT7_9BACT|nr:biopolymer transporter Tol [Cyclobacterium lianum]SHN22068.1 component of the Tol biopolymer transport system [Cyclobacterium lianum]
MRLKNLALIWLLIFCGNSGSLLAQFDQERFGKNRIQHKDKDWYYFTSNNFEVYYYDGGQTNARRAIDFLEGEFDNLTQSIGYVAYTKPKIFIYNSNQELLESNLNLNNNNFTVDGQTFFSKLLAEVAYSGSWESFKTDLLYNTSKIIIEEMLYGSSISDAFQANLVNNFPDWFIDGAALYLAKGWSREMDDFVRHYLRDNENPKLFKLQNEEAGLVGQSIWNYIVEKYGKRYISSILNLSRINRNEENSISNTLGRRFRDFTSEWQKFYTDINKDVFQNFKDVNESNVIVSTPKNKFGAISGLNFSPDGKHLAYIQNTEGKFRVKVRELVSGRESVILRGGYSSYEQDADYTSPAIAWRDTLNLVIATFKRGVTTLRMRAIDGSSQDKIFLRNITQILGLDFAPNGQTMVLSAINNGQTDIYTLNMRGQGRRITNDVFDDRTPIYLNDSTIIYSSNKTDLPDSLMTGVIDVNNLPDYYNLFQLNLGDTISEERLTNLNHINLLPKKLNNATILHLSEQSGIANIMRLGLGSNISSQVSAFNKSLESFDYDVENNKWAYAVRDGRQSRLVLETFPNMDQFTPSTPRIQLKQAKMLNERISNRRIQREDEDEEEPETGTIAESASEDESEEEIAPQISEADTSLVGINLEGLMLGGVEQDTSVLAREAGEAVMADTLAPDQTPMTGAINVERLRFEREGGLDTDNYTFDTIPSLYGQQSVQDEQEDVSLAERRSNILDAFRQQNMVKRVQGPRDYIPQFITTSLNTSFVVDPLRGFGINLNGRMTDLLDNHSIKGGVMTAMDFSSGSDIYFEYEYLKYRLDFRGRFDRRSLMRDEGDLNEQKYVLTKSEIGVSYPLSVNTRISLSPFVAKSQYFNLNPDSILRGGDGPQSRLDINFAGARAELVVDKTRQLGLYMEQGLKGKIGLVHYQGLNLSERSFSNVYLDFRNYQKIHKNITLATRLFAGGFYGNNPQKYLVGGMDNWLFNQFHQPPTNRPEVSPVRNEEGVENSNLLFAEFVDLRGFDYDEIRGNNVITFNAELRIPLFSYLSRGNITSNFVRNFQLVGFYDAGSAWTNSAPWERVNDQNTEVINTEGSPFVITLNNFNNPWLQSYGAGIRTVLLNYYVKVDAARPIRNYSVEKTRFYVTLGYNF